MSQSLSDNLPVHSRLVLEDAQPAMQATPYARSLLGLIHATLAGHMEVHAFCQAFGDFYIEHQPDLRISLNQAKLFAAVQQQIDWTEASPTVQLRQNGWCDHAQFLLWLRQRIAL